MIILYKLYPGRQCNYNLSTKMLKVCLLGPQNSGKTYFVYSIRQQSKQQLQNTMGVSFFKHTPNSYQVQISYWDVCGKGSYLPLSNNLTQGCDIVLLFYNPINNTMDQFSQWASSFDQSDKKVYVIVNKPKNDPLPADLISESRKFGWIIKYIDAEHSIECEELQTSLIEENMPKNQNHKLKEYLGKAVVIGATIGLGMLVFRKQFR